MKKTFIVISVTVILLTAINGYANSKGHDKECFRFGFSLNPLISSIRTTAERSSLPGLSTPASLGISSGLAFSFELPHTKGNLSLQTGAMMGIKTYKMSIQKGELNIRFGSLVVPIEIPVILSLAAPTNKSTSLREFVGLKLIYTGVFSQADHKTFIRNEVRNYEVAYELHYPRELGLQVVSGISYHKEKFCGRSYEMGISYHYGLMNESIGKISYRVGKESHESGIANRGSYFSVNFLYFLKQKGGCPNFR